MVINLTLFIQIINVVISVFFIKHFLAKPVLERIEKKAKILSDIISLQKEEAELYLKIKMQRQQELEFFINEAKEILSLKSSIVPKIGLNEVAQEKSKNISNEEAKLSAKKDAKIILRLIANE